MLETFVKESVCEVFRHLSNAIGLWWCAEMKPLGRFNIEAILLLVKLSWVTVRVEEVAENAQRVR